MKKAFLLFGLTALIYFQAGAQTELLTLAENKLKGAVKSATTKAHWQKEMFGEWENSSFYFGEYCAFNKDGFLTSSYKEENNDYKKECTFKYDGNNRLVQQKDEYGKPKDKSHRITKYVYDAQGREKEHDVIDSKGELVVRYKLQYREDGRVKERVIYSNDGRVSVRMEYTYDSQNRLITTTTYNPDDKVIKKVSSEFDSQGNKVKEEVKEFVGKNGTDITYYWAYINGRKARETKTTLNNDKERRYSSEFDEWGNIIKEVPPSGTVINTVYTFDQNKNWITAISSWKGTDGTVMYKRVREIQYY